MHVLVSYIIKAAVRDRLFLAFIVLLSLIASMSFFFASASFAEKMSFATVFTASSLRLAGVFMLIIFTTFFIRRSYDSKDIEFLLARPVSRVMFYLSYSLALSLLALFITLFQGLALCLVMYKALGPEILYWFFTLLLENIVVVNCALFFSMIVSSTAISSLASVGFYVLSRLLGQIFGIIDSDLTRNPVVIFLQGVMEVISVAMPRLDLAGQSVWLVHGVSTPGTVILQLTLQIVGFTVLITLAGMFDLQRKQF